MTEPYWEPLSASAPDVVKLWDSVIAGTVLSVATITTPPLDQTFTNLIVHMQHRISVGNSGIAVRINGSITSYYWTELQAHGGVVTDNDSAMPDTAFVPGNASGFIGVLEMLFPAYCDQTGSGGKSCLSRNLYPGSLAAGGLYLQQMAGVWQVNTAISTLSFVVTAGTWQPGTRICVYGER